MGRRDLFLKTALKLLTVMGGAKPLVFLLRDEFVTAEAAPIASPRACEPGPGTLTVVQNDGQMSIADGKLNITAQVSPAWTDQGFYAAGVTRKNGVAIMQLIDGAASNNNRTLQFRTAAGINSTAEHAISRDAYGLNPETGYRIGFETLGLGLNAIILRSAGAYFIYEDMLYWARQVGTTATLYPALTNSTGVFSVDFERIAELPSPFNAADGLTLFKADTVTDGQIINGAADGTIYFTWTPSANEVLNVRYRRVDDDNCMILRCDQSNSTIKIIRRWAGAETEITSAAITLTAGTARAMWVRFSALKNVFAGYNAQGVNALINNSICGYNYNKTGVKFDGSAGVSAVEIIPFYLTGSALSVWKRYANPYLGGYKTPAIIDLEDGGDIDAAIATMKRGDILNLAANGTYTITAGTVGIASLPNGFVDYPTEIRGNGATIVGGTYGFQLSTTENFKVSNLNFLNQTLYCIWLSGCRNFEFTGCTAQSVGSANFADTCKIYKCKNFTFTNCVHGPSTGITSVDGFECYGECENGTFTNCEATGVVHGFEVWVGASPNWLNSNIRFVNCSSHNNTAGYSCEGGAQMLAHENIVCENCTGGDNTEADFRADAGATLYRLNSTGTIYEATGGHVTDL